MASIYSAYIASPQLHDQSETLANDGTEDNEYQITIIPPHSLKEKNDVWIDAVREVLKSHGFDTFVWMFKGRKTIEVINLFYVLNYRDGLISDLLAQNGLLDNDPKLEIRKISERNDYYNIEFGLHGKDYEFGDIAMWTIEVDDLLTSEHYDIYETHHYHDPTVYSIPYPPWREAEKIISLIKKRGLNPPSEFRIFEYDPTYINEYFLSGMDFSKDGVLVRGFVPMKYDVHFGDNQIGDFIITIVDPQGSLYSCRFEQLILKEFNKKFPEDFVPNLSDFLKGDYKVIAYVDGSKIMDLGFTIDENKEFREINKLYRNTLVYSSEGE